MMSFSTLNLYLACPAAASELIAFEESASDSGMASVLIELVRLRTSQLNFCQVGIHRHARRAMAEGTSAAQLEQLPNWRDAKCFSDEERAAFAWTEAVVTSPGGTTHREDFIAALNWFGDEALIRLTLVIAATFAANVFQTSLGPNPLPFPDGKDKQGQAALTLDSSIPGDDPWKPN